MRDKFFEGFVIVLILAMYGFLLSLAVAEFVRGH